MRREVAVIGGGPAGLMAAEVLAAAGINVTVYDRMPSVGRKLLMAGRSGLNITHSEELEHFLSRYGFARPALEKAIRDFPPAALRQWCEELGQPVFVGSSGRVFPKSLKASPLLRAWLLRLKDRGVRLQLRRRWLGWDDAGRLIFRLQGGGDETASPDAVILALGGGSWPRLGSDGAWVEALARRGVTIAPLRPANCGFQLPWSDLFCGRFEGQPLKTIALSYAGRTVRGEAVVTAYGIEGGPVYTLSAGLRDAIAAEGRAVLSIDLCPDIPTDEVTRRLDRPRRGQSQSTFLKKALGLPPVAIGLLHESSGASLPAEAARLAALIKAVPLPLSGCQPLERAISTAGGVHLGELDERFMLRALPGVFVAGEMLDWEAPTGGYLLQACFATGRAAAAGTVEWLKG